MFLEKAIAIIILLGGCIFIHELGHFLAGLLVGIRPKVFSIGFGPAILSKEIKGIDFRLSAFPLGGYVQFHGEDPSQGLKGEPYEFLSAPPWKRMIVLFAGPFFNYVLGFSLLFFTFFFNSKGVAPYIHLKENFLLDKKLADSYKSKRMILKEKDRIIELDGVKIKTFEDILKLEKKFLDSDKSEFDIVLDRSGKVKRFTITREELIWKRLSKRVYDTSYSFFPYGFVKIGYVVPSSPAAKGGLKTGDIVLSIDGYSMSLKNFYEYIRKHPKEELVFKVKRGDRILDLRITPRLEKDGTGKIGVIPVYETKLVPVDIGIFGAVGKAFVGSVVIVYKNLYGLWSIVTGKISLKESVGGPIMIAKIAADTVKEGWFVFLNYMAIISIVLMVMNLLPIPPLDGWHLVMGFFELIRGKPISYKVQEKIMKAGFVLLLAFIIFIIILDIGRLLDIKR